MLSLLSILRNVKCEIDCLIVNEKSRKWKKLPMTLDQLTNEFVQNHSFILYTLMQYYLHQDIQNKLTVLHEATLQAFQRRKKRYKNIYKKSLATPHFLIFCFQLARLPFLVFIFFISLFSRLSESLSKLFFRHCTGSFSEFLDFWIFWMFLRHLPKKVQVKNHCCVYTQQTT